MHPIKDYIALAIATLPASAILAVMICIAWPKIGEVLHNARRWMERMRTRRLGSHYRGETWLSQGRTAATQQRTRR